MDSLDALLAVPLPAIEDDLTSSLSIPLPTEQPSTTLPPPSTTSTPIIPDTLTPTPTSIPATAPQPVDVFDIFSTPSSPSPSPSPSPSTATTAATPLPEEGGEEEEEMMRPSRVVREGVSRTAWILPALDGSVSSRPPRRRIRFAEVIEYSSGEVADLQTKEDERMAIELQQRLNGPPMTSREARRARRRERRRAAKAARQQQHSQEPNTPTPTPAPAPAPAPAPTPSSGGEEGEEGGRAWQP